ncbi:hypothetical protein [Haloarchaeobius sp. DFWS5]|uniref:hypothetical protein n=1 Tax=Haloarchaeobius sp. DFWS5 TaxID=3446114 RepID=UPI003EB9057D
MDDHLPYQTGPWTVVFVVVVVGSMTVGSEFVRPTTAVFGAVGLGFVALTYYYYRQSVENSENSS